MLACTAGDRGASSPPAPRPNIVFILLDDVRYDDMVDHPFVNLPNLNRLASEGASFRRFFTAAPLCSPSRAVFMTGQYPYHNGIVDNGERAELSHRLVTFPKLLQDAGYHTGFFGKWHMGHEDDSPRPGFHRWVSFVGQGVYFDPKLNIDGTLTDAKGYMTDILTAQAVSFIASAPVGTPFLAFIAQKAAHPEVYPNQVRSFPPAPGDEGAFANDPIPHGESWRAPLTGKPALQRLVDANDPRSPKGGLPDKYVRDRLRMLLAVDRGIGEVRKALEAKGVLDQTVFIVTSDQGFFYGEFGLAQERRLAYEPSTHIPLIVRYPGVVPAGVKPNALASNVDIAPTMLDLGGAFVPTAMDGRSLLRALRNDSTSIRDDMLIEYYSDTEFPRVKGMGYKAVRTDRYKYIRYEELRGMDELYDLQADPYELRNLLPDQAPVGVRDEMSARLDRLLKRPRP
ncbi:sulfatase-like hydrolase/transferase [Gemmatimonas sp.]|uniref:sulfatase-like hydrolase/transferase n=1 Tax=Gemmatimonas sp. TaxID=1962908 RepID=UPI0039839B21